MLQKLIEESVFICSLKKRSHSCMEGKIVLGKPYISTRLNPIQSNIMSKEN